VYAAMAAQTTLIVLAMGRYTFLLKYSIMLKNQESQSRTINGQTESVHETDKVNYVEILQNCRISKNTANCLACIMVVNDLYDKVFEALMDVYGENTADEIIHEGFQEKYAEIESVLYGFVNDSIRENINSINLTEI